VEHIDSRAYGGKMQDASPSYMKITFLCAFPVLLRHIFKREDLVGKLWILDKFIVD